VFGGTLPSERSRLRDNTFPSPSVLRERRELAEQAHQLADQVGLRQAARQLGIHWEVLKAAFTHWERPMPQRRVGWQPSRFLTDRAEAERAFHLAEQLGSVNAAAAELGTTWPSLRKAFTRHGLGMPALEPGASLVTSQPCGCAVVRDAQLVLERSGLLQVPLPLWCSRQGEAKLGVRERGVERHAKPLGCGQAGPPGRPGPSRPAREV
jgi:hypothetical protein